MQNTAIEATTTTTKANACSWCQRYRKRYRAVGGYRERISAKLCDRLRFPINLALREHKQIIFLIIMSSFYNAGSQ